MAGKEKLFENALRIELIKLSAIVVKIHGGGQFQIAGLPDLMLLGPNGIVRFAEIKHYAKIQATPNQLIKLLSKRQWNWIRKASGKGVPILVAAGAKDNGIYSGFVTRFFDKDSEELHDVLEWLPVDELAKLILNAKPLEG